MGVSEKEKNGDREGSLPNNFFEGQIQVLHNEACIYHGKQANVGNIQKFG